MTATMWTPPKPRAYNPRKHDPGQRISWTRHEEGHWTELPDTWGGRMPDDSKYVKPRDIERSGTIWSDGPSGIRSVWVQPDDAPPGEMVLVHTGTLLEQTRWDTRWQHDTVRRCNKLAGTPGLYREYKNELRWPDRVVRDHLVAYHADPACPAIEHQTDRYLVPAIGDVIRGLLKGQSDNSLCATCVWLNPDKPAEAAV